MISIVIEKDYNKALEGIKILLDAGADVNAKDKDGKTPLNLAAENAKESIAKLLRSRGAK